MAPTMLLSTLPLLHSTCPSALGYLLGASSPLQALWDLLLGCYRAIEYKSCTSAGTLGLLHSRHALRGLAGCLLRAGEPALTAQGGLQVEVCKSHLRVSVRCVGHTWFHCKMGACSEDTLIYALCRCFAHHVRTLLDCLVCLAPTSVSSSQRRFPPTTARRPCET